MSSAPMLTGLVRTEGTGGNGTPPIMIRTRKKTIVPRSVGADRATCAPWPPPTSSSPSGPAGTGKTYLAVAQAVRKLHHRQRPAADPVAPRGRSGRAARLPAGRHEGEGRPLSPPALRRALRYACRPSRSSAASPAGEIEIAPIAFMRGRTLADAFVILDEAQNTTPVQMKMFLTRFGQGSRMVVCGDPKPGRFSRRPASSGLRDAVARSKGWRASRVVRFGAGDVVRHPIVGRIVEAYEGVRMLGARHPESRPGWPEAGLAARSPPRASRPRSTPARSAGSRRRRFTVEISRPPHRRRTRCRRSTRAYRGKDKPTNVLSFPMVEPDLLEPATKPTTARFCSATSSWRTSVCAAKRRTSTHRSRTMPASDCPRPAASARL